MNHPQHLTKAQAEHMALVAPQPETFDRSLFDAVMAEREDYVDAYGFAMIGEREAYRDAARIAARIVAERAAPVPSDEALKEVFESTRRKYAQLRWGDATLEGIKAVRAALQPVPEVPEGWVVVWVVASGEAEGLATEYRACLWGKDDDSNVEGAGPTWHEALAAAISEAEATP